MSPVQGDSSEVLSDLLTVIITTSPTPSAPATDLVSSVLASFRLHCPALITCRVVVVFDTFDKIEAKARLKKGSVTPAGAAAFSEYKENVKQLVLREYHRGEGGHHGHAAEEEGAALVEETADAEYGLGGDWNHVALTVRRTPDSRVVFVEPARRLGFGLAVRTALRLTRTPYVWVHQHDWTLVSDVPLDALLRVMRASEQAAGAVPVKYVCLPSVRMLAYAESSHVTSFPELRRLTAELRGDFAAAPALGRRQEQRQEHPTAAAAADGAVPLTPLFFWHDKPHVASTAHYLARVFPSRLAMPRGAFIEDTVGQRARAQMKAGEWEKWACWLYYPDDGRRLCVKHLNGRMWKGPEFDSQMQLLLSQRKKSEIVKGDNEEEC